MNYLPHRYSTKSVYRFVPVIETLILQHRHKGTAQVSFSPTEMSISVETAIARLRDACHSLSAGLVTHPNIDANELKAMWPLYKVTSDGFSVRVIPRLTEQGEPVTVDASGSRTDLAVLRVEDARFAETLSAFALLLGSRYLQGQVTINGDLSETLRHRLESENDVVFVQDGLQKYHMI